jgi:hypothetical protein
MLADDLATLTKSTVEALARPLIEGTAQWTMPLYPLGKYEGLVNGGILYPFTRALYGTQVRYPLALDFGVAGTMITRLATEPGRSQVSSIFWPGVEGALTGAAITQVSITAEHNVRNENLDLSAVLGLLTGALFEDAEKYASTWQRIRGSRPTSIVGAPSPITNGGNEVGVQALIESFNLAMRNLQELWGLVLPPVTMLELKKLSRLPTGDFHLPDALWARVVYDFALAHRLRTISRTHLLGALTPIYLAWVASYAAEVRSLDNKAAELRVERLATAFEEAKPYFVSRWRWPDRFNP